MEREKLVPKTKEIIGPYFQKKLREFEGHPAVGEVRGHGLIGAMELLPKGGRAKLNPKEPLGPKAAKLAREEGLIVRGIRDIMALSPALVIEKHEIDQMFQTVAISLDRLWE
jgi:adenosylmethionine-8-amino-7-oxononanoate aminotransferase